MALEDFTTYTKGGTTPNDIVINNANSVTLIHRGNTNAFLWKSFGANYFNPVTSDITINYEFLYTPDNETSPAAICMVSTEANDLLTLWDKLGAWAGGGGHYARDHRVTLLQSDNPEISTGQLVVDTHYYCTIDKKMGDSNWHNRIYADADRLILVWDIVAVQAGVFPAMEFFMPLSSYEIEIKIPVDYVLENVEILSPAAGVVASANPLFLGQDF